MAKKSGTPITKLNKVRVGGSKTRDYNKRAQTHPTEAANTSGLSNNGGGNNNGGGGGGGGGGSGPVSTLAGLPQTPLLKDLIAKGIIREGMPQETALAILAISQVQSQGPIDLKALKDMITADYGNTTGDIFGPATDWMQQLYGTNTPLASDDPNAALFAQDPIWGEYAGGLQQMQETANTNQATDLAWLDKQQQAMDDYYSGLVAAASAGQLGGDTGGGSGGGGGGRRHYGGGGGSGGGSDDSSFSEPDTKLVTKNVAGVDMDSTLTAYNPGWYQAVLDQFGDNAFITDAVRQHSRPDDFTGYLSGEATRILADMDAADQTNAENQQWTDKSPEQFQIDLQNYLGQRGLVMGDDPTTTDATEFQYEAAPGQGIPVMSDDIAANVQEFNPLYQQFLSGESLGLNPGNQDEALQYASDYLTKLLDPNRVDPLAAKLAAAGLAGKGTAATPAPGGGGGNDPNAGNYPAPYVPSIITGSGGVPQGSIPGDPNNPTVMVGNNPSNPPTVTPNGQPIGEQTTGLIDPKSGLPWSVELANMKPHPDQLWAQQILNQPSVTRPPLTSQTLSNIFNPGTQSTAERAATNATGGFVPPNQDEIVPPGGGNSMADAVAQLPPEILQAAAQHAVNGPPAITDINWALMQAGEQPLGTMQDGSIGGGPQSAAAGNFGSSRPMFPDTAQLGMGGNMPASTKQMPMSDPVVPPSSNAGGGLMGAAPSAWHKTLMPADQREAYRQQMLAEAPLTSGMGAWNLLNNSGAIQQAQAAGPSEEPYTPSDIVNMYQGNIWTTDENGARILKPEVINAYQDYSAKRGQDWQRGYNATTGPNPTTPGQFYDKINIMPDTERATNEGLMKAIHDAIALTDPMNPQLNFAAVKDNMNIGSSQNTTATSTVVAKDNPEVANEYTGMEYPDPLTPDESYQMDDEGSPLMPADRLQGGSNGQYGFKMPTMGRFSDPYTIGGGIPQLMDVPPKMDQFIQQAAQNMTRKKTGGGTKSYKAPGSSIKKTYQTTGKTKTLGNKTAGSKQTYRKW